MQLQPVVAKLLHATHAVLHQPADVNCLLVVAAVALLQPADVKCRHAVADVAQLLAAVAKSLLATLAVATADAASHVVSHCSSCSVSSKPRNMHFLLARAAVTRAVTRAPLQLADAKSLHATHVPLQFLAADAKSALATLVVATADAERRSAVDC